MHPTLTVYVTDVCGSSPALLISRDGLNPIEGLRLTRIPDEILNQALLIDALTIISQLSIVGGSR